MARSIALIGDSIFDNSPYIGSEPDVVHHLRDFLPPDWTATLLAVDGARAGDVELQLRRVPQDASHLVVSAGGNNALAGIQMLEFPVISVAQALDVLSAAVRRFEADYRQAIESVLRLDRDTTLCTIYNGDLPSPLAERARIALALFNDVILRTAIEKQLRVLDLRLVCTRQEDYANPIEPSGPGGRRIAEAIAAIVLRPDSRTSQVYGSPAA